MESDDSVSLIDGRAGLSALIDALEARLAARGVPAGVTASLMIAADEVISNSLDYGGAARVEVALRVAGDQATLEIADDGPPFDPLQTPPPDTTLSLEDRSIGGLGVHLVKTLTDSVAYEHSGGRNRVRFSKSWTGGAAS